MISQDIVEKIAKYTNKKIQTINTGLIEDEKYRAQKEKLRALVITPLEIYAFTGILILLGITKKSNESIESLWNSSSFAAATMPRDRFQLISRNIKFDDLESRSIRNKFKFHKIQEIFDDFKNNLELIIPSNLLCVDEELYAFRGV